MRSAPLGSSNINVSEFTLGTMNFGKSLTEQESINLVATFVERGGTFLDTADCYGDGRSESVVGAARRKLGDVFGVCTKTGRPMFDDPALSGYRPTRLRSAAEDSLRRLGVERIDMYQLHQWDPETPIEDAVDTLTALVNEGKIAAYGLGNVPARVLGQAYGYATGRGVRSAAALQYHYSLGCRDVEVEILPACVEYGAGLMAWSPLSGGLLTGKYATDAVGPRRGDGKVGRRGYGFEQLVGRWPQVCEPLVAVADETDASPAATALSWLLNQPGVVTAIVGASSAKQLADTLDAPRPVLTGEHIDRLNAASPPRDSYPNEFLAQVLPSRTPIVGS